MGTGPNDAKVIRRASRVLKILSHPSRLRLIELLSAKKHSVGNLTKLLSCEQAVISKHLALLKKAGLVACERERNYRYYYLERPEILKILECVRSACRKGGTP